jgi:hypothetical protein
LEPVAIKCVSVFFIEMVNGGTQQIEFVKIISDFSIRSMTTLSVDTFDVIIQTALKSAMNV